MDKFVPSGFIKLSVSTVKQIAGRAGRYGLLDGGDPGGTCTTLHAPDHSYLRECLATPFAPLEFTRIGPTDERATTALTILPPDSSLSTIIDAHIYIGRIPIFMRYATSKSSEVFDYADRFWNNMNIMDRFLLLFAPIPWRDKATTEIIKRFLNMHSSSMSVDFMEAVKDTGYLETFLAVEDDMGKKPPHSDMDTLLRLESFHKVVVFYIWMSFRNPVVYSEFLLVLDLKERMEKVLNWSLDGLSKSQGPKAVIKRPMDSAKYLTRDSVRLLKENNRQKPAALFNSTQNPAPPPIAASG
jgi:ATP-dependent RNA helicase SUPV3L1/SUV3